MSTQMEFLLYSLPDDEGKVQVVVRDETLWCTQKAMAQLFGIDRSGITRHLNNFFKEGELDEKVACANIALTTPHGAIKGKTQTLHTKFYNHSILPDKGKVSRVQADRKAKAEYDIFNRTQPVDSDFDKCVRAMLKDRHNDDNSEENNKP